MAPIRTKAPICKELAQMMVHAARCSSWPELVRSMRRAQRQGKTHVAYIEHLFHDGREYVPVAGSVGVSIDVFVAALEGGEVAPMEAGARVRFRSPSRAGVLGTVQAVARRCGQWQAHVRWDSNSGTGTVRHTAAGDEYHEDVWVHEIEHAR